MTTTGVSAAKGALRQDDAALQDDVAALKADMAQLRSDLRAVSHDLVDAARAGATLAKDSVGAAVESAMDQGKARVQTLEHEIKEKPLLSVGIALGIGLLLGSMLRKG